MRCSPSRRRIVWRPARGSASTILRLQRELEPASPPSARSAQPVVAAAPSAADPLAAPGASGALTPTELAVPLSAPPPAPDVTQGPRWWTWTLFGAAAVSLSASGVFELSRAREDTQARSSQIQVEHQQSFDAMHSRQTAARVFLGVGAAAALAGGVSLYFDLTAHGRSPDAVALGCDTEACLLHTGGQF
jgi:hypothetical protein